MDNPTTMSFWLHEGGEKGWELVKKSVDNLFGGQNTFFNRFGVRVDDEEHFFMLDEVYLDEMLGLEGFYAIINSIEIDIRDTLLFGDEQAKAVAKSIVFGAGGRDMYDGQEAMARCANGNVKFYYGPDGGDIISLADLYSREDFLCECDGKLSISEEEFLEYQAKGYIYDYRKNLLLKEDFWMPEDDDWPEEIKDETLNGTIKATFPEDAFKLCNYRNKFIIAEKYPKDVSFDEFLDSRAKAGDIEAKNLLPIYEYLVKEGGTIGYFGPSIPEELKGKEVEIVIGELISR